MKQLLLLIAFISITFCYSRPPHRHNVQRVQSESCGVVIGIWFNTTINYGYNVEVTFPNGWKTIRYTQAYYPIGSTFCCNL